MMSKADLQKIEEQDSVLKNDKQRMLVSASAGSGKTHVMIEYIGKLIIDRKVQVKDLLVLTFTKAAATEMKERLQRKLKEETSSEYIIEQIDALSTSNISTIHAFCEKYIKKYANLLNLSENFEILDENLSQKLRQTAFENALKKFEQQHYEAFADLMFYYKNDKSKLQNIVFQIENLVSAVADKDAFLNKNTEKASDLFERALDFIFNDFKTKISNAVESIKQVDLPDKFKSNFMDQTFVLLNTKDIYDAYNAVQDFALPRSPMAKTIGVDTAKLVANAKKIIQNARDDLLSLNLSDQEELQFQRNGVIENLCIKLFEIYEKEEESLKKLQNCLDFNDLEKYMKILSTRENLFKNIKYVFIDEYQDTNKVQEKIIKNVAKNCNFVAVGDVKQGIYGFRLASSEIFLKDLKDFNEDKDSSVKLLKSNFRSNPNILNFVNDIFKVCMTFQTAGVDYLNTSMLEGRGKFVAEDSKNVFVDVVKTEKKEKEIRPEIYSVEKANISEKEGNQAQVLDIKRRILEIMSSKISDNGTLRPCKFGDITILARKRDDLFVEIEETLQNSGIPVISNTNNKLMDEPEIKMLVNYLKLTLNPNDEIALLSVLVSGLYRVNIEDILRLKQEKSLFDVVFNEKNDIFSQFLCDFDEFKLDSVVVGVKKAFTLLFNKTGYRGFINTKTDKLKLNSCINQFLNEMEKSGYNFDIPSLINYFETVGISVASDTGTIEDAVLLTTIHNSKGLEYPIVFLVGCDKSLSQSRPKVDVEINEEFGLAVKFFDRVNNKEIITARMKAIKLSEAEKDFVEELMIFYVALTRAKNRLYLFGNFNENSFNKLSVRECDSYFDLIFYALKELKTGILAKGEYISDAREAKLIENLEEVDVGQKQNLDFIEKDENVAKAIEDYINFKYHFSDNTNFKLKESVTELSRKENEDVFVKYNNDNFTFSGEAVEIGNAYHLALKLIDFERINDIEDVKKALEVNRDVLDLNLIDINLLYKNIQILKPLTAGRKVFKEKEFVMKDEVGKFLHNKVADKILVQGVVDLFIINGNEAVLIDYKYSNAKNSNYLVEKYKEQLMLYKYAIENGLNVCVSEMYLLSLKNALLIPVVP